MNEYLEVGSIELEEILTPYVTKAAKQITAFAEGSCRYMDHRGSLLTIKAEIIFDEIKMHYRTNITEHFIKDVLVNMTRE